MSSIHDRTPILVGAAQFTQRTAREGKVAEGLSPIAMMAKVAREAFADAGAKDLAAAIDTVAVVRFTADSPGDQGRLPKRTFRNPPLSLANHPGNIPSRGGGALPTPRRVETRRSGSSIARQKRLRAANAKSHCSPGPNISPP